MRSRIFIMAFAIALALSATWATPPPARVVAIGDIHGDFDAFAGILQKVGLIDANHHWSGRNTTFVQTGDYLDRGPKTRAVLDLLMQLQKEAPRQNGRAV